MKTSLQQQLLLLQVLLHLLHRDCTALVLYHQSSSSSSSADVTRLNALRSNNSRRKFLRSSFSSLSFIITANTVGTAATSAPANAAASAATTTVSNVRVSGWPGIESLEPMYEFKLSVDAIASEISSNNNDQSSANAKQNWPYIQKRLEKFFGGLVFNEKNFYMGVGLQYMNEITYDSNELPNYVLMDKQERFDHLQDTINALERLKNNLKLVATAQATTEAESIKVQQDALQAQASLAAWFAMIPTQDVHAVQDLFQHVKKADTNRDGRLSDAELIFLSPREQDIWKQRVAKFG